MRIWLITGLSVMLLLLPGCSPESQSGAPDSAAIGEEATRPDTGAGETGDEDEVQPGPDLITPDGWGPLRIGMSRSEVVAASGEDANPEAVGGPDPETCDEFRPVNAPDGVLVMIRNGVLTRISVSRTPDISTPSGFRVGDSGSVLVAAYGARARVEPHQYQQAPAKYITAWRDSAGEQRGIRYEVDASDRVIHIRAGDASIEHVEGCV